MIFLNDKINAYLTINNIDFIIGDFQTGIPDGQEDQILKWDNDKLGKIPSDKELNDSFVIWEDQQISNKNKENAKLLLAETDWVEMPSVANTDNIPHLVNILDFIEYRLTLRSIVIAPTSESIFPTKPTSQWAN